MKEKEKLNEVLEALQSLYLACDDISVYENPAVIIPAMRKAEQIYKKHTEKRTRTIEWRKGEPPRNKYGHLLMSRSGIICSGQFRSGTLGEPQQSERAWRCDCCGKFMNPIGWCRIPTKGDLP